MVGLMVEFCPRFWMVSQTSLSALLEILRNDRLTYLLSIAAFI